jgi:tetratricopeptide (TPR) repeat protein/tRNA A-37 threonylcarbamoyl transferase component Bud32
MSIASEQQRCPKCGGPIPPEAPQGLCPMCLLAEVSIPTEAGQTSRAIPPLRDELAAAFPHLEILELIGQGGMGFVFKARQPKLDRFVALKILSQSLAADPAFAERFTREGRVLARLSHPNIVAIHDFGLANGFFYLLMEFVDGVNLRQAMRAGRFTPDQALAIVPKICEALQYAHNEGILHRDIKPENILIDIKGRVKIADFGIAKLIGDVQSDAHLTGSGATLGTPHYMAPEQIEKPASVDHRADIYSLGVVFYEMLTGELPLGRFAAPSEKSASDPRLDDVVFRTLEKEPGRRPQSAGAVKTQVDTIVDSPRAGDRRQPPVPVKNEWAKTLLAYAAFFFASMSGVLGCLAFFSMPTPSQILVWSILAAALAGILLAIPVRSTRVGMTAMIGGSVNTAIWLIVATVFFFRDPRGEDPNRLTQEGWQLWQARRTDEAAAKFARAVKVAPNDANAWNGLGWASFNSGQAEEGEKAFRKVIALEPNHPAALNGLGQIYLSQKKYDLAETYLLKAAPQAPAAWYGLARLNLLLGKFEEAERWAQNIIDSGQADEVVRRMLQAAKAKQLSEGLRVMIEPPSPGAQRVQASAETWAPSLAPGEKPDLRQILADAKKLADDGRHEEALQRHLWYHNHALDYGPGHVGVRLSFALSYWMDLAQHYPKARQALIEIRDRGANEFARGGGSADLFMEASRINEQLGEPNATYALFKSIQSRDPKLARQCYRLAEDLLVEKGEYALCASFIPNVQDGFKQIRALRERTLAVADRTSEVDQTPLRKATEQTFIKDTRKLIEILVGVGRKPEAEQIREQAVAVLNVPELQSAVADAEQKVAKVSAAAATTEPGPPRVVPTANAMRALAKRICEGDEAAFGELRSVATELYRDVDVAKDQERARSIVVLMRAAFDELGNQAGRSNAAAMAALQSAAFTRHMKAHVPNALGIAAAAGNEQALEMLLHHQDWNILLSSTVFALRAPAEKNNEQAIDFLANVLGDSRHRPLWYGASNALQAAAANGSAKAKAALEQQGPANPK